MLRLILLLVLSCGTAWAQYAWPERVVPIEELRLTTPIRISVPQVRMKGEVRGPAVLRVHVDAFGQVRNAALLESCGSPAHDEAALQAMREVRFLPKLVNGTPVDVTLVVPLHLPVPKS